MPKDRGVRRGGGQVREIVLRGRVINLVPAEPEPRENEEDMYRNRRVRHLTTTSKNKRKVLMFHHHRSNTKVQVFKLISL